MSVGQSGQVRELTEVQLRRRGGGLEWPPAGRTRRGAWNSWASESSRPRPDLLHGPASVEAQRPAAVDRRVHEQAQRIVERVQVAAGRVQQPEAEVEAPVRERQPLELEAQLPLARLRLPAELRELLLDADQQLTLVVAHLDREPRRPHRL